MQQERHEYCEFREVTDLLYTLCLWLACPFEEDIFSQTTDCEWNSAFIEILVLLTTPN
jgi:hypothetical protein